MKTVLMTCMAGLWTLTAVAQGTKALENAEHVLPEGIWEGTEDSRSAEPCTLETKWQKNERGEMTLSVSQSYLFLDRLQKMEFKFTPDMKLEFSREEEENMFKINSSESLPTEDTGFEELDHYQIAEFYTLRNTIDSVYMNDAVVNYEVDPSESVHICKNLKKIR